jgi:hypothetical protein
MALTLVEISKAKLAAGDYLASAVIEVYAASSDILRVLPFKDIPGGAFAYNMEEALPGIGFRGVNEGYTESTGVINPVIESLAIAGGDCDVDNFIIKTRGADSRGTQEAMKVKALAHRWGFTVVKGDTSGAPREFDGLQRRLQGSQVISNSGTSGGGPLSLTNLDALIDSVESPTHLLMTRAMRRLLTAAARNTAVGGFIRWEKNEFGQQMMIYNDLPILLVDMLGQQLPALAFNEAGTGGGSTATSIYCVNFSESGVCGIQNGDPEVIDLGMLESRPTMRTRVEWYAGLAVLHPRAAGRLRDISNAAVVV